jgi:hypothetical protein
MIYMGVDVYKSYLEIAQADEEGKLRSRSRVMNTPESIDELAGSRARALGKSRKRLPKRATVC